MTKQNKLMSKLRAIVKRNSLASMKLRKLMMNFYDSSGLVYFGTVDQHKDDYKIIKGLTASAAHLDEHCGVGSIDGYDISVAYRTDIIEYSQTVSKVHSWLIFEFSLFSNKNLPHIFIEGHDHRESPYTKLFVVHPALQKVPLGTHEQYSQEFTGRYTMFSQALHFIEVQEVFDAQIARTIAAHFWPLSIEVFEDKLYIYSDNTPISKQLLETISKNGLWLASQIDNKTR